MPLSFHAWDIPAPLLLPTGPPLVKLGDPQANVGVCSGSAPSWVLCTVLALWNRVRRPFLGCCTAFTTQGTWGGCANSLQEQGWAIRGALSGGQAVVLSRAPSCTSLSCTPLLVGISPPIAIGEHHTGAGHLLRGQRMRCGQIKSSCMGSHGISPCKPSVHRAGRGAGELVLARLSGGCWTWGGVRKAPQRQRPSPCS